MTVTDPKMTRFLMSLDEAILLVEHAFTHAQPGDLFIRKAPASTIEDLATAVAELMGVEPKLEVIGTRHGEKLYETLATREELVRATDQGDYFRVALDARDLNYDEYFEDGEVVENVTDDYHSHNTLQARRRAGEAGPAFTSRLRDACRLTRQQVMGGWPKCHLTP